MHRRSEEVFEDFLGPSAVEVDAKIMYRDSKSLVGIDSTSFFGPKMPRFCIMEDQSIRRSQLLT